MRSAGELANEALELTEPPSEASEQRCPEEVTKTLPRRCAAFGCPLPGTIRSGSDWRCRFHQNRAPTENDKITLRIKRHMNAIKFANRLTRSGPYDFENDPQLNSNTLPREEGENLYRYRARVNAWIDKQIHGNNDTEENS